MIFRTHRFNATKLVILLFVTGLHPAAHTAATSAETQQPLQILFENVRIFDGRSDTLSGPSHVLVKDGVIQSITASPPSLTDDQELIRLSGNGATLIPGLIDMHTHVMLEGLALMDALRSDLGDVTLVAARSAEGHLMRGFTTIRDVGGPAFAVKRAIDKGIYAGPRIYPSGAMISQTAGHGDFRLLTDLPREPAAGMSYLERHGFAVIADGPDEVLRRTRENLMRGASQIKLMAGGGVSSTYDPLDVVQYTAAELQAAVQAAENWGTYVTVHAYNSKATRQAIESGVKCIEHGHLLDEDTVKMMAARKVWWSLQPFLDDEDANPQVGIHRQRQIEVSQGTDLAYRLAKKHRVRVAFGTDALFAPQQLHRQGAKLTKLLRWYSPAEVLRMATSENAALLALSGPRNPYPGKLGVIEEGALADLLLVDGNPLADLKLLENPERNFLVIMKDGKIFKNIL